jgi:hypothetical protein
MVTGHERGGSQPPARSTERRRCRSSWVTFGAFGRPCGHPGGLRTEAEVLAVDRARPAADSFWPSNRPPNTWSVGRSHRWRPAAWVSCPLSTASLQL